jgi:hypothetical protein
VPTVMGLYFRVSKTKSVLSDGPLMDILYLFYLKVFEICKTTFFTAPVQALPNFLFIPNAASIIMEGFPKAVHVTICNTSF